LLRACVTLRILSRLSGIEVAYRRDARNGTIFWAVQRTAFSLVLPKVEKVAAYVLVLCFSWFRVSFLLASHADQVVTLKH
jgi:hypothetical protein